jgi:PAS domain S-box-containing protein
MQPPLPPTNEAIRLAALLSYGVLDTPPDAAFDQITALAARLLGVPVALVSLVDDRRQWFKSRYGLGATETPREVSFCGHVVEAGQPLVVPDACVDERFADNPLVTGDPRVRFYAGVPLHTPDGFVLGTLCAIDHAPRDASPADLDLLRFLADQVVGQLELQRTARRHRREHARLQALLQTMQDGVVVHDPTGRVVECNVAATRILGLTSDQLLGRTSVGPRWHTIREDGTPFPGHEHPAMVTLATGSPASGVVMGVVGAGGVTWISIDARPLPLDDRGVLVTFRDVTGERAARADLARERSFLRTLLDQLPRTTLVLFDGALQIDQVFGTGSGAWEVGDTFLGWFDAAHLDKLEDAARQSLGGVPARIDTRREDRHFELSFVPVPEGDRPVGLLVAHDVTERSLLQERLARQDRLATTGTLASGVGHELNNPLSYMIGNLDYAVEELQSIAGVSSSARLEALIEVLVDAREGSERIRKIVQGLRALARESSEPVPVSLPDVIEVSLNLSMHELRQRCSVVRDLQPVPPVLGDEARLSQVVVNLLVNAAQSFPTSDVSRNQVTVRCWAAEESVWLEVADNGPGILPEVLPRIWDPFFTTKPVGVGTGLGLAICHNIVTSLGGELTCDTGLGRGTTFRLVLPSTKVPGAPNQRRAPTRGRVLVVDDEPMLLRSIERLLRNRHEVVAIDDPREALRRIEAGETFDVVLCDITMPHLRGDELYARVRPIRPALAERFVFVSGGVRSAAVTDHLVGLQNELLEKPLDTELLRRTIRRFTGE